LLLGTVLEFQKKRNDDFGGKKGRGGEVPFSHAHLMEDRKGEKRGKDLSALPRKKNGGKMPWGGGLIKKASSFFNTKGKKGGKGNFTPYFPKEKGERRGKRGCQGGGYLISSIRKKKINMGVLPLITKQEKRKKSISFIPAQGKKKSIVHRD